MGSGDVAIPCPLAVSMESGSAVEVRRQNRFVVFGIYSQVRVQGLCHTRRSKAACNASPSSCSLTNLHCLSESLWPKAPSGRNRQRRYWGGSDHSRSTDEAPTL